METDNLTGKLNRTGPTMLDLLLSRRSGGPARRIDFTFGNSASSITSASSRATIWPRHWWIP